MSHSSIPSPGLGTYRVTDHDTCVETIQTAIDTGYRHIDTAEAYGNEAAVGAALDEASVDREELFLATKVFHPKFTEAYSPDSFEENVRACLDRLGVDRVDLLYAIHWPEGEYDPEATFERAAGLANEGLFDRLGVCNMTPELVDEAREASPMPITAVQVEMHPLLPQRALRSYCAQQDIDLVAYAPLGNGRMLEVPELTDIADAHGVSPARVSIAWALEKGVVPIPKSTTREHIVDNFRARELALTDAEIERIDAIGRTDRQYDPGYAPAW